MYVWFFFQSKNIHAYIFYITPTLENASPQQQSFSRLNLNLKITLHVLLTE